jgi:hypothetical protein
MQMMGAMAIPCHGPTDRTVPMGRFPSRRPGGRRLRGRKLNVPDLEKRIPMGDPMPYARYADPRGKK